MGVDGSVVAHHGASGRIGNMVVGADLFIETQKNKKYNAVEKSK